MSRAVAFALLALSNLLWAGNWVTGRALRDARLEWEKFNEEVQVTPAGVETARRRRAEKVQPANPVPGTEFL